MNTPIYVAEIDCTIDVARDTITPSDTAADNCMTFSQAELAGNIPLFPGATQAISIYDSAGSAWAAWRAYWTGTAWEKLSTLQERGTLTQPGALTVAVMPEDGIRANYLSGCDVEVVSVSAINVKTGGFSTESGEFVHVATPISVTGITGLPADTWHQVYAYNNNGTPAAEVSAVAPAAPYFGNARSKTGDDKRRLVGFVLTDGAAELISTIAFEGNIVFSGLLDYVPISAGVSTSYSVPVNFFPIQAWIDGDVYSRDVVSSSQMTLNTNISRDGTNDHLSLFSRVGLASGNLQEHGATMTLLVLTNASGDLWYKISFNTESSSFRIRKINWERS